MIYLAIAFFWFVLFGAACSGIAKSKNLDPAIWFFIGGVLGIIGLILVAVMPGAAPGSSRSAPAKTCAYCGKQIAVSFRQCPECGRGLPDYGTASVNSWEKTVSGSDEVEKWTREHPES